MGVSLNCSTKHRVENSRKEHCRSRGSLKLQTSPYESTKYDATSAGENAPHPIVKIQRGRRQTRLLWKERDLWIKRREGKGKGRATRNATNEVCTCVQCHGGWLWMRQGRF